MNITGFQSLTLSDFPARTAALVFTQGCNFRCPFCHNPGLVEWTSHFASPSILRHLQQRRRLLDGVVVTGGEPTLQPDLGEFLAQIKAMGLQTKLDTNGSFPEVLQDLLRQNLLDYVAMDIKAPWDYYERLAGVAVDVAALQRSVQLIAASGIEHQFRTTWVKSLLSVQDLQQIQAGLPVDSDHRVQPFISELAADPDLRLAG